MNRWLVIFALLSAVLLLTVAGCDKMKINVPGNVTGQLLNEGGQPQGFTSVKLCDSTGAEVQVMTSDENGSFFFEKVPAGEYTIKITGAGGNDMPSDAKPVKLGPGKTLALKITMISPEEQAGGEQ